MEEAYAAIFKTSNKTDYYAKIGQGANDDIATWYEVSGGSKKRIPAFPGLGVRELLGGKSIEQHARSIPSSSEVIIDQELLQKMVDDSVARQLGKSDVVQRLDKFDDMMHTFANLNRSPPQSPYRPTLEEMKSFGTDVVADYDIDHPI